VKKLIHIILPFIFLFVFNGLTNANADSNISFPSFINENVVNKPLFKGNAKVYPNPFVSEFTLVIEATSTAKIKLHMHNVIGKNIWSGEETVQAGTNKYTYTFDNIENGIYYLTIINGDIRKSQKVIKK